MKRKAAIKETLIKSDSVKRDGMTYTYVLTARESGRVASYRIPLYSISVSLTDPEGNETHTVATDAFSDIGKALVFYERIVEHLATPLNLQYVLEDEYCT